jgi:hypothetical protein
MKLDEHKWLHGPGLASNKARAPETEVRIPSVLHLHQPGAVAALTIRPTFRAMEKPPRRTGTSMAHRAGLLSWFPVGLWKHGLIGFSDMAYYGVVVD